METKGKKIFIIPGLNPVKEALLKKRPRVFEVWVIQGKKGSRFEDIRRIAEKENIPVITKKQSVLENMTEGVAHQGVLAIAAGFEYSELGQLIKKSREDRGPGLILIADHITDEGNLGAIIRSAVFFNAQGLVLPKDRSAGVTEKVMKRSSGACFSLAIAREVNLGRTLERLKDEGFWVIGTAGESRVPMYSFDWNRELALVLGSEGKGLSPKIRNHCDELVSIPSSGLIGSLNVSVAAGVFLSEIQRQRGKGRV